MTKAYFLVLLAPVLSACGEMPHQQAALGAEEAKQAAVQALSTPLSHVPAAMRPQVAVTNASRVSKGLYQVILKVTAPLDTPALVQQNGGKPLQPGQNEFAVPRYVVKAQDGKIYVLSGDPGSVVTPEGKPLLPILSDQDVKHLTTVTYGSSDAPRHYLLFADMHCPYCHQLMFRLKPLIDSGRIRVDVAPVPVVSSVLENTTLRPDNAQLAYTCLTTPIGEGQAQTCGSVNQKYAAAISANRDIFKWKAGLTGVPTLYERVGGKWQTVAPQDDIAPEKSQ